RIKKMEAKQGGYVGLPKKEIFADQPIMPHGLLSVFIDERSFIGKNCIIHEQVVVGRSKGKSPTIGDGCFIGAGAKIIGGITIGENCRIGAGCVVVDDVPNDTTVVSQKPRYIHKDENYKIDMDTQNEGVKNE
ncbi:MAG: DapH/DapD/GlmU-related protein, partial [Clostridia bacterium]